MYSCLYHLASISKDGNKQCKLGCARLYRWTQRISTAKQQKKKRRSWRPSLVLALSIFPGRRQPSIVDRNELNYRVRNGNGWTLILISTNSMSSSFAWKQSLLYCLSRLLSRLFVVTRTGFEPMLTAWEAAVLTTWPTGHGAPSRTRTGDPLIKSQLLYQLS